MGITIFKYFRLGRYIVGYTFGNHVLRLRLRVAVKLNFRPYIRRYTSPNENFEYRYPLNLDTIVRRLNVKFEKCGASEEMDIEDGSLLKHSNSNER